MRDTVTGETPARVATALMSAQSSPLRDEDK